MNWEAFKNVLVSAGVPTLLVGVLSLVNWFPVTPLGAWEGNVAWLTVLPTFLGGSLAYILPKRSGWWSRSWVAGIVLLAAGGGTLLGWWLYDQKTSRPANLETEGSYNLLCFIYFVGMYVCFGYLFARGILVVRQRAGS